MRNPFYTILALMCLQISTAFSQNIIRGPYLQSVTHESIIVMWRTDVPSASKVWIGTDTLALTPVSQTSASVTNHIVKINNLSPSTKYYYAVGNSTNILGGASGKHYFKTHPLPGTQVPVRIWAIGDFGRGNSGQVAVKQSFENYTGSRGADVWLWLGDNAYQDGKDSEYQNHVFAVPGFSDIFSYTPFWPSPGNHDYNTVWSESTLLGIPYTNIPLSDHEGPYFDMVEVPKYAEAGGFASQHEVFYSFDYGDVHFLSLNSEVFDYTLSYDGINQMKSWITQDLNQNTRKFTIAYFHQPPYSKGSHDSDDAYELVMKAMREKVIPLLESYDIDLVVCGHSHVFERSYLIKGHYGNSASFNAATMMMNATLGNMQQGTPYVKDGSYATPEGTVYVVCGNSGSSESSPSLNHPAMAYTHGGSNAMGSFIMDVYKNRLDAYYLKSTGEITDSFTILKKDLIMNPQVPRTICAGQSTLLTADYSGGSDNLTFLWNPGNLSGDSVLVSPTSNTTYTLTITDMLTGQSLQSTVQVNILSGPNAQISEVIPGTLGITDPGPGFSFQWYINGNPIMGANTPYYTPVFNGTYTLVISSSNGCNYQTDPFIYQNTTSLENAVSENEISVYPNPNKGLMHIRIPKDALGSELKLMDISGKEVYTKLCTSEEMPLEIKNVEPGMYLMQISTATKRYTTQVLLTK